MSGSSALSKISSQSSPSRLSCVRTFDLSASGIPMSSPMLTKLRSILSSELASIKYCFVNLTNKLRLDDRFGKMIILTCCYSALGTSMQAAFYLSHLSHTEQICAVSSIPSMASSDRNIVPFEPNSPLFL